MTAARHDVIDRTCEKQTMLVPAIYPDLASVRISFETILHGLLIVFALFAGTGCQTLTIPAFDPSGNRIFASNPTRLTLPQLHGPTGTSIVPNAAYPEPAPPANCLQGPAPAMPMAAVQSVAPNPPSNAPDRGRCGQMLLTPTRIVAPVGGEVVLLAGICGEDGYLVTKQPIEWMLAPDSVGQIVEVGDDLKGKRKSFFAHHRDKDVPIVEKLDVDFARGRTSSEARVITRGSQKLTDDLILKKGQTWVSLTSPTEGLSRVTVLAPESEVWDRRRQTATIYWVDASWQFPGPQTVRVGEPATLVTLVKKAEGFEAATGWIVKYRILTPEVARFANTGSEAKDELIDLDGKSVVQIVNGANTPGTAVVGIEIAKPASSAARMPELPIAKGQTMVTWSGPNMKLQVQQIQGIRETLVGQAVDYRVVVANTGDLAAENVQLRLDLGNPALQATFPNQADAPEQQTQLGAIWNLGNIPALQQFETIVRITPTVAQAFQFKFNLVSSLPNGQTDPKEATLNLTAIQPEVQVSFLPDGGNGQVEVGQSVVFKIIVTNSGRTTLGNINLTIDTDVGLQHAENGSNRVSNTLPPLSPGEQRELGVRFIVRKVGDLKASLIAQSGGLVLQKLDAIVRGIEAVPRTSRMKVMLQPEGNARSIRPNQVLKIQGVVQNLGQTRLTNLQLVLEYEPSLVVTGLSPGAANDAQRRQAVWRIGAPLDPGQSITIETEFRGVENTPIPRIALTVQTGEGVNGQDILTLDGGAVGGANGPPVLPGSNDVLPQGGLGPLGNNPGGQTDRWSLTIRPLESQVLVNQKAQYVASFSNNSNQPDQNVAFQFDLPQGVKVVSVSTGDGEPVSNQFSDDSRSLREIIRSLREGETLQRVIVLEHAVTGTQILGARISSAQDPQGASIEARIIVRPNL